MLRVCAGLRGACAKARRLCTQAAAAEPAAGLLSTAGIPPAPRPAYQTHEIPVYSLPFYGAPESTLDVLSDPDVSRVLKAYGGLLRKRDTHDDRRERLLRITRDRLTITGCVVSDKMDKSVVIASRRRAFAKKIRKEYGVTRRFMAHDEQNLCREGDRVTIRSCRPMSRRKAHVVVRNYGDKARIGADDRASTLEEIVAACEPTPPVAAESEP
jgi:small subunit ribosomal protein S17